MCEEDRKAKSGAYAAGGAGNVTAGNGAKGYGSGNNRNTCAGAGGNGSPGFQATEEWPERGGGIGGSGGYIIERFELLDTVDFLYSVCAGGKGKNASNGGGIGDPD